MQRPDRGHVRLGDRLLFDRAKGIDVPARDRRVSYVFQDCTLFAHLSLARNITLGPLPTVPGRLSAAHQRKVTNIMQARDMGPPAAEPEGDQRQRVPGSCLDTRARGAAAGRAVLRPRHDLARGVRENWTPSSTASGCLMVLISLDLDDERLFADALVLYEPGRASQITHRQGDDRSAMLTAAEASLRPTVNASL